MFAAESLADLCGDFIRLLLPELNLLLLDDDLLLAGCAQRDSAENQRRHEDRQQKNESSFFHRLGSGRSLARKNHRREK